MKLQAINYITEIINIINNGWCQKAFAVDVNGNVIHMLDKNACSFCLNGAIYKVYDMADKNKYIFFHVERVLRQVCGGSIAFFNDKKGRTKEEIIQVCNEAIEVFKQQETNINIPNPS